MSGWVEWRCGQASGSLASALLRPATRACAPPQLAHLSRVCVLLQFPAVHRGARALLHGWPGVCQGQGGQGAVRAAVVRGRAGTGWLCRRSQPTRLLPHGRALPLPHPPTPSPPMQYVICSEKPEQEQRLLSALVNKLGDPERKLASKVGGCECARGGGARATRGGCRAWRHPSAPPPPSPPHLNATPPTHPPAHAGRVPAHPPAGSAPRHAVCGAEGGGALPPQVGVLACGQRGGGRVRVRARAWSLRPLPLLASRLLARPRTCPRCPPTRTIHSPCRPPTPCCQAPPARPCSLLWGGFPQPAGSFLARKVRWAPLCACCA